MECPNCCEDMVRRGEVSMMETGLVHDRYYCEHCKTFVLMPNEEKGSH